MGKMADLLVAILEFPVILYAFPIAISWKLAMDVKLVIERGAKNKQTLQLRSEETIVGRRDGCDLRIPSAAVSRRHCRLSFHDEFLVVEDLDSANGTYLNGERVTKPRKVKPGDRLEIGP